MSGRSSYGFGSCCYADCTNSYSTHSNVIFFKFPNDDTRRKKWIANCGNPEVAQLSDRHLRGKRICAVHFAENSFTDATKREVLTDKAVPGKYVKAKPDVAEVEPETPSKRRGRPAAKVPEKAPASSKARRISETAVDTTEEEPTQVTAETPPEVAKVSRPVRGKRNSSVSDKSLTEGMKGESATAVPQTVTEAVDLEPSEIPSKRLRGRAAPKLIEKAVPKSRQVIEETADVSAEKITQAATFATPAPDGTRVSPRRGKRSAGLDVAKPEAIVDVDTAVPQKGSPEKQEIKSSPFPKMQSKFGKALYSLLNDLLYDAEPTAKKDRKTFQKPIEILSDSGSESKTSQRIPNGRVIIKSEKFEPRTFGKVNFQHAKKQGTVKSHLEQNDQMMEQYVTLGGDSGNLILQNGGQFTLAEGQEYEVIGESDAHDEIQVIESENNDTIEIIEVDDQTMAQLTAQNVFFPNSGNLQVSELDPNQILKVINPSEAYYHSSM